MDGRAFEGHWGPLAPPPRWRSLSGYGGRSRRWNCLYRGARNADFPAKKASSRRPAPNREAGLVATGGQGPSPAHSYALAEDGAIPGPGDWQARAGPV